MPSVMSRMISSLLCVCAVLGPLTALAQTGSAGSAAAVTSLALMPVPRSVTLRDGRFRFDERLHVAVVRHTDPRLERAVERTLSRLELHTGLILFHTISRDSTGATLVIDCAGPGEKVQSPAEDESYTLDVTDQRVTLHAATAVGVIRGLQTIVQLVSGDVHGFYIPALHIEDSPRFAWRGLLVDVSRHFEPVDEMKRTLDGMEAVKLNVLHWHLSDDQGIRVESKRFPLVQQKASGGKYYTQAQIRDVVAYARDRGIRVVPEFDMPGHSNAWLVAYPKLASYPGIYELGQTWSGYYGTLDPTNERVYRFIDRFVGEMTTLFPDSYWHIGGDEVVPTQWNASAHIIAFRKAHNLADNAALQAYFNQRVSKILTKHHRHMIGWDEILHPALPHSTIIQSWRGTRYLARAAAAGFNGILSAPYYLDAMRSSEYLYLADPLSGDSTMTDAEKSRVLGGEATMWAELVNNGTIDSRIWPRLAAIAERFWSPENVRDVDDMYRRLRVESYRLEQLGLTQVSHTDRLLRNIVGTPSYVLLHPLTDFAEPVALGQRIRARRTIQLTPLVELVDAARPDPPGRWQVQRLVNAETSPGGSMAARDSLRTIFRSWIALPAVVSAIADSAPLARDAVIPSSTLARVGTIGLTALDAREHRTALPSAWSDSALVTLKAADLPQGMLHLTVIPSVRQLLVAPISGQQ